METMTFGDYNVTVGMEAKKLIVEKENVDGTVDKIFLRKMKKTVRLVHNKGNVITFSTSMYQGKPRFKDSREPKKSYLASNAIVAELVRMLHIDPSVAKGWLVSSPLDATPVIPAA